MQRLLIVLAAAEAVATPKRYDECHVEDGGLVETTANTGVYVGLRQGCSQSDQMVETRIIKIATFLF